MSDRNETKPADETPAWATGAGAKLCPAAASYQMIDNEANGEPAGATFPAVPDTPDFMIVENFCAWARKCILQDLERLADKTDVESLKKWNQYSGELDALDRFIEKVLVAIRGDFVRAETQVALKKLLAPIAGKLAGKLGLFPPSRN